MVAILIVLTIVVFIAIELAIEDHRSQRSSVAESNPLAAAARQQQKPIPRAASIREAPADLFFHPGHTWARPLSNGLVEVGADDFALSFIGRTTAAVLPTTGEKVVQGRPAWTLVSTSGRRLPLVAPITGEVVEVAPDAAAARERSRDVPGSAPPWTLRVRPACDGAGLANLLLGRPASAWLAALRETLSTRHAPLVGAVSPDGGAWHSRFGEMLDDRSWGEIRSEFFSPYIEANVSTSPDAAANDEISAEEWR
jgi:glycine cleavage system H lipoate-binding protein